MPETLGQRLRQAREERHLALEKVAESTRIRLHYLQALETDDYSLIPSAAQARGFLRNYADFLGIDLGQAVAEVQRARPQPAGEVSGPLPKVDLLPDAPTAPHEAHEATQEETRTPPILTSFLARFRGAAAAPETGSPASRPAQIIPENVAPAEVPVAPEIPPVGQAGTPPEKKKRSRKKAESETPPPEDSSAVPANTDTEARARKKEQPPAFEQTAQIEPIPAGVEETQAEAESPPGASGQAEVPDEAQGRESAPNMWSRFTSLFHLRLNRREEPSEPDPVEPGPAVEVSPSSSKPFEKPEEIFAEIGRRLRQRRELLSLTLDEVERHIRVRAVFVKALEDGAYDRLPSAVQTRGMLVNYAAFLDLDTDAILLRFADAIQAGHRLRYPEKPGGNKSPMRVSPSLPPLRSFIAGDLIFGISIAVLLVTMAIWGLNRVFSAQAERAALPTAPSISDVLATSQQPTALQEVTLIPAADTPLAAGGINTPDATLEVPAFDVTINVQVTIVVVERTFLRVAVDGEEALNGRVLPGATYTYEASESVEVLTGNAAALRITYNGRDLGLMGNFGEVVNRMYTSDGVITPTPAAPATATPTLSPTPSPTPSATPKNPSPAPDGG